MGTSLDQYARPSHPALRLAPGPRPGLVEILEHVARMQLDRAREAVAPSGAPAR